MEQKVIDIPVYTIDNSFGLLFSVCALSSALWFIKGFLQQVENEKVRCKSFFEVDEQKTKRRREIGQVFSAYHKHVLMATETPGER